MSNYRVQFVLKSNVPSVSNLIGHCLDTTVHRVDVSGAIKTALVIFTFTGPIIIEVDKGVSALNFVMLVCVCP